MTTTCTKSLPLEEIEPGMVVHLSAGKSCQRWLVLSAVKDDEMTYTRHARVVLYEPGQDFGQPMHLDPLTLKIVTASGGLLWHMGDQR